MYTILITNSNELITSQKERIMQRSKLVDTLHFLVDPIYKEKDMSSFTVLMEYLLPVSREYHSEILILSDDLYKNKLEYKIPFDTSLTKEAGNIEVQISFIKADLDADGKQVQYVRKTSVATITIVPISAWSDIIPDASLSSLDQRIIKTEAMISALEDMSQQLIDNYDNKADDLSYENGELQLIGGGKKLGTKINIKTDSSCDCEGSDSIKIIEF